jgi:hypothetical protein
VQEPKEMFHGYSIPRLRPRVHGIKVMPMAVFRNSPSVSIKKLHKRDGMEKKEKYSELKNNE